MIELLTIDQVAQILKLTTQTVLRMVHAGKLPAVRVGRTYRVEAGKLKQWLEAGGEKRK